MKKWLRRAGLLSLGVVVLFLGAVEILGRRRASAPLPEITASRDPAVIRRGAYLVQAVVHCEACHASSTEAGRRVDPELRGGTVWSLPFGVFHAPNLTPDRETGLGAWSDAEIARAVRHGVGRDGAMLAFMALVTGPLSDADLTAVVSYLRSRAPVRNAVPRDQLFWLGRALRAFIVRPVRVFESPPGPVEPFTYRPSVERGRYLASAAVCVGCHSPLNADFSPRAPLFSGGEADPSPDDPHYEIAPPNITRGGALAVHTEDSFVQRFRAGRVYHDSKMPWEQFARMTDADLRSLYQYLASVPAIPVAGPPQPSRRLKR